MTREEALKRLKRLSCHVDLEDATALDKAIEALLILGEDGIINCCGCIYWNEYGFCNLTDKHREDFDYCSDGRREE